MNMFKSTFAAALFLLFGVAGAHAVTFFGNPTTGFTISGSFSNPNNNSCSGTSGATCFKLNQGSSLTITANSGTFSLMPFWADTNGQPAALTFKAYSGAVEVYSQTYANTGSTVSFAPNAFLTNLTSIFFDNTGTGTAEISDLVITSLPNVQGQVPLPAASLLLVGGLGGLAALKRRKKAA